MIYSCFNQSSGYYDYFEDDVQIAINADLPIPKLPPPAGRVGVPAIDAGRPLPASARPAGHGWHAKGIVVMCGGGSLGSLDVADALSWFKSGGWIWVVAGAATVFAVRRFR